MAIRTLQKAFSGGEVTPELFGRIDDVKYQAGLAKCRNFITKPQGPAENRAGTRYVRKVKDSAKKVRLIPFTYSTTQTMVIEVGNAYLRFHTDAATLLAGTPGAYRSSATVTMTIASPCVVTLAAHGFTGGEPIQFTTTGALPAGLTASTTYYVKFVDAGTFRVAATVGGADINTSGTQSGVHTVHRVYGVGDLVASAGVNYYCILGHTVGSAPPNAAFWYPLPATGEYEIPTPYLEADLFDLHYVQSADVLTIVHPNYEPRELRRYGATNWQLVIVSFVSPIAAPTGQTATPSAVDTTYNYSYVITALDSAGVSESVASAAATCTNNLFTTGRINTIAWAAVATASRYNVYKLQGGLYGYIGQTTGTSIVDDNIAPDLSKTPPIYDNAFTGVGNYPAAVSYFEQRRCLAGTTSKPQNIWMTKSGTESDMSYSLPIRDDDRIAFRIAAREANTIRHIVPLSGLILLTSGAEWRVTSVNSDAITPSSISVRPQSYVGASNVQPAIINNTLLYCAARGGHVRELGYQQDAAGFVTGDVCLRAPHLFDGYTIVDMAYAKAPQPITWFVSSNGTLLGLTYVPEQQIGAWHWHDTDGVFESCAAVAEGNEDMLYIVVRRTINGASVRYIERLESRRFTDQAGAFFVDCGLTYNGAPTSTITGLGHLEAKTVSILADGAVHPQRTVTGGAITLDVSASVVQAGLPITADLQTLPIAAPLRDGSFAQSHVKNVNKAWLRVYRSSGIFVGPSFDKLREVKQRTTEAYGSPPGLKTEEMSINLTGSWGDAGQICVRQSDPLPLTVVCMTAEVELGS